MLTSNGELLFCVAWWADHVMLTASATFSVRNTSSNQEYSSFKCEQIDSGAGKDWLATGGGLGFFVMYAG